MKKRRLLILRVDADAGTGVAALSEKGREGRGREGRRGWFEARTV